MSEVLGSFGIIAIIFLVCIGIAQLIGIMLAKRNQSDQSK